MSESISIDQAVLQQWVEAKREPSSVEEELLSRGMEIETVRTIVKTFRKLKNAKKQFAGFIYLGIGAFLGFISCVLTIINPVPELYNIVLYGLTMLAICLIMLGLYFVFE